MEHLRHDHERRRFHLARERARSLPGLPFCGELVRDRHQRRADLAVKAVLGLDHADMVRIAELFCGLLEREHDVEVCRRRELDGQVFAACALLTDG